MQEEPPIFDLDINPIIRLNLNITTEVRDNGTWKPVNSSVDLKTHPELAQVIFKIVGMSSHNAEDLHIPENTWIFYYGQVYC